MSTLKEKIENLSKSSGHPSIIINKNTKNITFPNSCIICQKSSANSSIKPFESKGKYGFIIGQFNDNFSAPAHKKCARKYYFAFALKLITIVAFAVFVGTSKIFNIHPTLILLLLLFLFLPVFFYAISMTNHFRIIEEYENYHFYFKNKEYGLEFKNINNG